MAPGQLTSVLRQFRHLLGGRPAGELTDGQLLEHFVHRREEAAFVALVQRHGPMVLGLCRRLLRREYDADDAFQATFLILAAKAASIRRRESVGGWLYEVAYHVALAARSLAFSAYRRFLAVGRADGSVELWDAATGGEGPKPGSHAGPVLALAFSADGRTLASGSADTTVFVWDISEVTGRKRAPPRQLDPREQAGLWADLGEDQASAAYGAVEALVTLQEKGVALIKERLRPPEEIKKRIARHLTDLDSDDYRDRERATKELKVLGAAAEEPLLAALLTDPPAEVRRRVRDVLSALEARKHRALAGEPLRALRAVWVLERVGGKEGRELLETLAKGGQPARVAEEAKAALARLARRTAGTP